MSASQKKKLRNEQSAAQMTEKQLTEQKEAKKLRMYTAIFTAAIILMLCVVAGTTIAESGFFQRRTVAATVGEYEISAPEFNHYYVDTIQQFQRDYGQSLVFTGLTPNVPMDEQVFDPETGKTWADHFTDEAKAQLNSVYALYSAAIAEGMTMEEEDNQAVDSMLQSITMDAMLNGGFKDLKSYIKTVYGTGTNEETYRHYIEVQYLASKYATAHADSLSYTDEQIREKDAEDPVFYNAYSYNEFYLSATNFLEGGTEDEEGKITYSAEEKAAAAAKCEEAAKTLTAEGINSALLLDKAIDQLELPKQNDQAPKSNAYTDVMSAQIDSLVKDWITAADRAEGDITMIPNKTTTTDDDGNEVTNINGYYVVLFQGVNDNTYPISNVRHILVKFEGGTAGENGTVTYSDEEKAAAKAEAEGILAQYQAGETTEDAFAKLATEKSDDTGSAANGGLIENILPSSRLVENFLNWSIDRSRKAGDTGIVESEYGYHVMYYVGDSERNYRDTMIENTLITDAMTAWEAELVEATPAELANTKYVPTDIALQSR